MCYEELHLLEITLTFTQILLINIHHFKTFKHGQETFEKMLLTIILIHQVLDQKLGQIYLLLRNLLVLQFATFPLNPRVNFYILCVNF